MTTPVFMVFADLRHIISLWSQLIFILVTFSSFKFFDKVTTTFFNILIF